MGTLSKDASLSPTIIPESTLHGSYLPVPYPGPETEEDNRNYALCAECGGKCYKSVGYTFSPQDFIRLSPEHGLTPECILSEVRKGYITLELYYDNQYDVEGFIWTPRARNKGGPIID